MESITYNGNTTSYEYNADGIRVRKNRPDGSYYIFHVLGGQVVGETRYNSSGSVTLWLRYNIDASGSVYGISLWYPGDGAWTEYYFVKNLQGDVMEVRKASDNSVAASYTYDAWGNILTKSGTLADINPFRYRTYYYDNETWFYYLESRYYDPLIGRFINADVLLNVGQGILGHNPFAYCGNSPVVRRDTNGNAGETIWDIISFGTSVAGVMVDPTDPWAWASLLGDAIDVVIPFFGGAGETVRGFKAVADAIHAAESANALLEFTQNSVEVISTMAETLPRGDTCVYVSYKNSTLEYVGITNNFSRRSKEWEGIREIHQVTPYLDRTYAHYLEQAVITVFGKDSNGVLSNIRNSIGGKGSRFAGFEKFFKELF